VVTVQLNYENTENDKTGMSWTKSLPI